MTDPTDSTEWSRALDDVPAAPVDARHQARMLALQLLYEIDLTGHDPETALAHLFEEDSVPPEMQTRVRQLVDGVERHRAEIDPLIAEAAPAYPLPQIAAIDRNVLRLAIYELRHEPAPPRAVINEAVELAKRFGGDHSARFVNGVLGTILTQMPDRRQAAARRRSRAKRSDDAT